MYFHTGLEEPAPYSNMVFRAITHKFRTYFPLIPIKANRRDLQAAIWAVGLTPRAPKSHFYLDNFLLIIYKYIVAT
jgi:hypothetical protein